MQSQQRTVLFGLLIVGVTVGYFLGWAPFEQAYTELSERIQAQQKTLVWMQQTAVEIQQLRAQSNRVTNSTNTASILSLIDKSIAQSALVEANRRVEPKDEQMVQVSFDKIQFNQLLIWLGQLDQQYQIEVKTLNVIRQSPTDLVNVRLVLQRSGSY